MANSIIMPKTGMAMETGVIVKWLIKEGDIVKKGEALAEIETDKSAMELESDYDGVILKILRNDGDTVPVTETIAWVGKAGEAVPEAAPPSPGTALQAEKMAGVGTEDATAAAVHETAAPTNAGTGKTPATPAAKRRAKELGVDINSLSSLPERGYFKAADIPGAPTAAQRANATPLARRIAENRSIPLEQVAGTGPGGKILKSDVLGTEVTGRPGGADQIIPLTSIQKITAKRMAQCNAEVPAVTIAMNADVTKLMEIRKDLNEDLDGLKISVNDFVVKAAALALGRHPRLNSEFAGDRLISKGTVNINIAVDTEQGLMVPVIRNADLLPLPELSARTKALAEKARGRKLGTEDMEGGTFTVSNVGMQGVTFFTPIINQPQTAILGVCAIEERLVRTQGGDIEGRRIMGLCLTFDHRAMDGAEAGRFLQTLKSYLEKPYNLLMGR